MYLARRVRRHWLFGLVLVAALALRVLASLAFRPIMWFGGDSASYLATGLRLIPDPARVGGYGFFLWALRPLHSFAVVAALQHLMGLAMGVLIYLLARRYGLPAWGATLATVPVLFDAYELQLEGDAVPGAPFGLLVLIALYLLLRAPGERRPARTTTSALAGGSGGNGGVDPPCGDSAGSAPPEPALLPFSSGCRRCSGRSGWPCWPSCSRRCWPRC